MVLFSAIDAAMAFAPSTPRPFADTSSCLPRVTTESKNRKRENSQKKVTNEYCSSLTDVMVLFSEIDAASAFPPSAPRPFADTSSCLPE